MLEAVLGAEQYRTERALDGREAVSRVQAHIYDLILMDIRMTHLDGMTALAEIKQLNPQIPIVMMTAYSSIATAVTAMREGAYDYLTKPLDTDELKLLIAKALRHNQLEKENLFLKEQLGSRFDFANIIGRSREMQKLLETIALVAPTEATVLIQGESGTGKELIANAIHQNSPRRDHPLIKVNCAALPETLLESELFGHEKGAFTGATAPRRGRFQLAHQGTLFLDEIGEMPLSLQPKILRVLQERIFEPVGSAKSIQVDTRIVTATNTDLLAAIKDNRFREDLFYRINVVSITAPPLRERSEDIPLLADQFLKHYAAKNHRPVKGFTPKAIEMLMHHPWPGNVRELENVVERAVIMARGPSLTVKELPDGFRGAAVSPGQTAAVAPKGSGRSLKEVEKEMILRTLAETEGNRTRCAQILGISRRTLQLKLKAYGVN
ncbi:MAG: sigma-54-dependent Fis family transcriptional regulator [Desulfatitalea sp.]|nr:sigma-54-dependent Fis family transcriptional regulator [Desulfatitalea sp.]